MPQLARTLLIFLHGSGGNGPELSSFFSFVTLDEFQRKTFHDVTNEKNIKYVCPTAKSRPYTAMFGEKMNVWFDRSTDFVRRGIQDTEDLPGADSSLQQIIDIINEKKTEYEHVFVGGFSQGGCLSLHMLRAEAKGLLTPDMKIRGIFSMGSFLVESSAVLSETLFARRVEDTSSSAAKSRDGDGLKSSSLPIFMMHGEEDTLIRADWGKATATTLLLRGHDVQFRTYKGLDHEISEEELVDLLNWVDVIRISAEEGNKKGKLSGKRLEKDLEKGAKEDVDAEFEAVVEKYSDSRFFSAGGGGSSSSSGGLRAGNEGKDADFMDADEKMTTDGDSSLKADSGSKQSTAAIPKDCVPFEITYPTPGSSKVTVNFRVPKGSEDMAISRPILACGGMFELRTRSSGPKDANAGVIYAEIESEDPHVTAVEIGKRLYVRLGSEGASLNACPMS